jgi:hypothetical protein
MAVVVEVNAISLYQNVGSVNVKLENPELLTALLLILLGFALVHWWTHPTLMTGGAISGGILGLACLVRFNPIFIAPFLAIAFAILTWKRPGILFSGLAVFTLTFLLVFAPYALSVKNSEGRNSYLSKIESVISERYTNARTTGKAQAISPVGPIVQSSANLPRSNALNDLSAILSHYLNNEISSLFILPVNLSFLKITDQVKQPIWEIAPNRLIWQSGFTLENLVVLALELFLVTLGVWHARKIMGIAGLSPLLIQVGYHFGNAVSRTSGGRYLEPVNWVVLFYFSIGVALLARWAVRAFQSGLVKATWTVTGQAQAVAPGRMKLGWIMGLFLVVGLVAPAMSLIPSQLPQETGAEINRLAAANFNSTNAVTAEQWNGFLASPNSLVVRGRAYDAQYYSNGFPAPGSASFELLLLGKEHVVVSYFTGAESKQTFANGSDVLLVGCQIGQDHLWGANRLIVHSFAVIQLDQEKRVYIDPAAPWTCGQ